MSTHHGAAVWLSWLDRAVVKIDSNLRVWKKIDPGKRGWCPPWLQDCRGALLSLKNNNNITLHNNITIRRVCYHITCVIRTFEDWYFFFFLPSFVQETLEKRSREHFRLNTSKPQFCWSEIKSTNSDFAFFTGQGFLCFAFFL